MKIQLFIPVVTLVVTFLCMFNSNADAFIYVGNQYNYPARYGYGNGNRPYYPYNPYRYYRSTVNGKIF
jgi:hypothetical protein